MAFTFLLQCLRKMHKCWKTEGNVEARGKDRWERWKGGDEGFDNNRGRERLGHALSVYSFVLGRAGLGYLISLHMVNRDFNTKVTQS